MKKLKKLALIPLAFLMIFGITSCKKDDEPQDGTEEVYTNVRLSTMELDTANVKKEYYLGEEFTAENLKVYVNYVKTKLDNSTVAERVECLDFSINTENIDMYSCGTYPVEVIYRSGTKVVTQSYDIVVKSTVLSESGQKYVGGIEVKYDGKQIETLLLDEEFTFDISKVECKVHYFKNDEEVEVKAVAYTKLDIDYSKVDTSKNGDYMIKYTYSEGDITFGDKTVKNSATSYTIIRVGNPVTSIEKISTGDTTFAASTEPLDFTKWQFKIYRENPIQNQVVNFSYDLFTVSGGVSFIEGTTKLTIRLIEDTTQKVELDVTVVESTTQNISIYTDLSAEQQTVEVADGVSTVKIGTDNVVSVTNYSENAERLNSDGTGKDKYNEIAFNRRIKIEPKYNGTVSINMEAPGTIVLFVAKAADSATPLELMALLAGEDEYEIPSQYITPTNKQVVVALSYDVNRAGTYTFKSAEGSVYFHGCVIATNK
ncbi:MAG: hypothetical protein E7176_00125 [Erysipelotrichaceae bacterium]|nr:hypothetical protein [Erysipelotrichaceae bacterium]